MDDTKVPEKKQGKTYNPLLSNVEHKDYSNIHLDVPPEELEQPIPEPIVRPNVISGDENPYGMLDGEDGVGSALGGQGGGPMGELGGMNDLSAKDKEQGAEHVANLILSAYEELNNYGNKLLRIPQSRINKLVKEGQVDLSIPIEHQGSFVSTGDIIDEFNHQNEDTLKVSKEFKREVKPVLKRVLAKRGVSMTDEQMLMYLFGKDIAVKAVLIFQVKASANAIIEALKVNTEAVKGSGMPPQMQPQAATAQHQPQPQPQPVYPSAETVPYHEHMEVPETGRERAIRAKKESESIKAAAEMGRKLTYKQALEEKKKGKRGRKPKAKPEDYLDDVADIAAQVRLEETQTDDNENQEPGMD